MTLLTPTVMETGDFDRVRDYVSSVEKVISDFGIYPRPLRLSIYDSVALTQSRHARNWVSYPYKHPEPRTPAFGGTSSRLR